MSDPSTPPGPKAPRWAWLVATGFGSGYLKPASGTWGSAAATLVWALLAYPAIYLPVWAREVWFIALPIAMTWLAVKASDLVVRETGDKDPGYIVADEFAGQWIALWPNRWLLIHILHEYRGFDLRVLMVVGLPFVLFRVFDVWKPWPARQIQSLPEGEGIVADDVVAGLYAIPAVLLLGPYSEALMGWLLEHT